MKYTRAMYTQREWDRVVGWGEVPPEYQRDEQDERVDLIERRIRSREKKHNERAYDRAMETV